MKKILFSFLALALFSSISFADCSNCNKSPCGQDKRCQKTDCEKNYTPCEKKAPCEKNYDKYIDDDEYCVYNQCFFDRQYRKMKHELCLTRQQENCIDKIYQNFKNDMEGFHARYRVQKNKLLEMIYCGDDCWREQRNLVRDLGKEAKEKLKDYDSEIKEQLCKSQKGDYRRFKRNQKKKMKRIVKYGAIYKLPCSKCCNSN